MRPAPHEPAEVVRVDPADGCTGVFRDAPVLAWLSHPADPASVSSAAFRVEDPAGLVSARVWLSPDGRLLVWEPLQALRPGATHFVLAAGLRDRRGRSVQRWVSRFVTGGLTLPELSG